jgi:hypothetical protein
MAFLYAGKGNWTGSGVLTDPSQWFVVDPKTGKLVSATYPSGGPGFIGGGTLTASGDFGAVALAGGSYVIAGDLTTSVNNQRS